VRNCTNISIYEGNAALLVNIKLWGWHLVL